MLIVVKGKSSFENLLCDVRPETFCSSSTGVVLVSVVNSNPGQSGFIVILDGRTFKEVPRAYVNTDLNKDMHGFFIPQ